MGVATILTIFATVSSAEGCVNFSGKFEYKEKGVKVEVKCKDFAELNTAELKPKCNKSVIAAQCPTLCNDACAKVCENVEGSFEYNSGKGGTGKVKTTSCRKLERLKNKSRKNKCKKEAVFDSCPGVCIDTCPFPKFSCVNFDGSFTYMSGKGGTGDEKSTTCEKVASKVDGIENKCRKQEISDNCPGVCDKISCPDEE
jgi:hypothetical protein